MSYTTTTDTARGPDMTATQNAQQLTRLTTATPIQIDTLLAALDHEYPALEKAVAVALYRVHRAINDTKVQYGHRETWKLGATEAVTRLSERPSDPAYIAWTTANQAATANRAEFDRLDAEYDRRGGWTRFVQVEHIHSGQHCAGGTLDRGEYRSERYWRPEFSGMDEATAIATLQKKAEILCTHCFPGAPLADKPIDPDVCIGSGKGVRFAGNERGLQRAYGKSATCPDCDQIQTVTAGFNYKTHFTPTAEARKLAEKATALGKLVVGTGRHAEIKTVRATELQASDPYRNEREREHAISALAQHRNQPVETVRAEAAAKRAKRAL